MSKNELVTVSDLSALGNLEITKELVESEDFASEYEALKAAIDVLTNAKKAIEGKIKDIIEPLYEEDGTSTLVNPKYNFTYVSATTRLTVDSAKLKKDFPDVYKQCVKTSVAAASMRVTERKSNDAE